MASADGGGNGAADAGDLEPQLSLSASPSLSGDGAGDAGDVEQRAPRREQRGGEEEQEQPRCVKERKRCFDDGAGGKKTAERSGEKGKKKTRRCSLSTCSLTPKPRKNKKTQTKTNQE